MGGDFEAAPSKVQNGAWWTLASCMSIMLIAGTIYGFSFWSPALKYAYDFEQEQIEMLAVASHIGNYIVLDSGYITSKFGPVVGMGLGCTYASLGYFGLWLSIQIFPKQVPFAVLVLLCGLYGHGCGTIDNAVMTESLADFKAYKGNANGCIKAYYGLATATVAKIYEAIFAPNKAGFLLFLSLYAAGSGLVFVPIVQMTRGLVDESYRRVKKKFRILACGILVFAVYFFIVQISQDHITKKWKQIILITVVAGMASLFVLPFQRSRRRAAAREAAAGKVEEENGGSIEPVLSSVASELPPPRNVTGLEMLTYADFWIFIAICVVGQGNGLLFIGNASQILSALAGRDTSMESPAFVATIAIFNSLARLSFGYGSEYVKNRVERSWFLALAMCFLFVGYSMARVGGYALLWPAMAMIGFGYGGLWGVQPTMVFELFGPADYAFKYSCSTVAAAIGSIVFNDMIAGPVYEHNVGEGEKYCYTSSCFDTTFTVAGACDIPAILLAVWLVQRTKWVYNPDRLPGNDTSSDDSSPESDG